MGTESTKNVANWEKWLQLAQVYYFFTLFVVGSVFTPILLVVLLFTRFWWYSVFYATWTIVHKFYFFTLPKPWEWLRNHTFWDHYGRYYPMKLHKTAELPPEKNYLLIWHPHGILSFSAGATVMTNITRFTETYPGITRYAATLPLHFLYPLRSFCMAMRGFIPSNFSNIFKVVSHKQGGNAVILAVGGAEESLESHEGNYKLVLNSRKGFVRLALKSGCSLVPVYAFGETSTYHQVLNPVGSKLRRFQTQVKKILGVAPAFFYGTMGFWRLYGPFPLSAELNTVVGAPIEVEPVAEPTQEQIDQLHDTYKSKLIELFEAHKAKYAVPEDQHLEFL
ncbi:unnamed protein product [Bursaphelenchus okinawaensis]|uniref:Acyltransferase n=1 Tax=Bursaphelenchus okinawaensis TaxID=465554 RepID=A0A811L3W2_9BILA|nr:unnamed protein product [Bursaphelenchus okinawaensis]CAG9115606.1 unnamed protein product [Bursaphelenchus okinawaensis]